MFKDYYSATVHRAARFSVEMSDAEAGALCLEVNRGHDASRDAYCVFTGTVIEVVNPGQPPLTAMPGDWIVQRPDGLLDVHADADFCKNFCPKTS